MSESEYNIQIKKAYSEGRQDAIRERQEELNYWYQKAMFWQGMYDALMKQQMESLLSKEATESKVMVQVVTQEQFDKIKREASKEGD